MAIRILVNGASGKMGQEVIKVLEQDRALELVAKTGRADNLASTIKQTKTDIVIDFTAPNAVFENCLTIIHAGARPVIGTTGLTPEQIEQLKKQCSDKEIGGIIAPNFSIGAVLMMQFAKNAAHFYSQAEIIELHHPDKKDAPSGTALKTAEMIAENRSQSPTINAVYETVMGSRGAMSHQVPIHAVRLPGLVASQEVIFGGLGETLSIRHNTIHREAFMPGVLLACKKVMELKQMVYGLENILIQ